MYQVTTTTPEIKLNTALGPTHNDISITAIAQPRWRMTPADVQEYLTSMGWTSYTAADGDWMYTRADIGSGKFMTWEQAVTYCLVKPFLQEVKK